MSGWIWVQTVCKSGQRVKHKKKILDSTFWLKPWLKFISFGYNFFHLAKVMATTNSEPELALDMHHRVQSSIILCLNIVSSFYVILNYFITHLSIICAEMRLDAELL